MEDKFSLYASELESPATDGVTITSSMYDSLLPNIPRALYSLEDGAVTVEFIGGTIVTVPILAGIPLPFRVKRILSTGTTVSSVVGVW